MLEGLLVIKIGFKVLVVLQIVLTWVNTHYKHLKSRMLQMPPRVHTRMPLQFQSEALRWTGKRDAHGTLKWLQVEEMNSINCKVVYLGNCSHCL